MLELVTHSLYADLTSGQGEGFICLEEQREIMPTKEYLNLCSRALFCSLKMVQALL